jgi:TonB-dependent receptor
MKAEAITAAVVCLVAVCAPMLAGDEAFAIDIPAGSLEDAILAFSHQTNRLVLAPGDALVKFKTAGLKGVLPPDDALKQLLRDTGIEIVSDDGRTVLLKRRVVAAGPAPETVEDVLPHEIVTVAGFRAALADSTKTKRASIGFTDAVFAEDIGKFSDNNIAESLNRIPGITISRDVNGEGVNIQIRGLNTNFTRILLNGNPIAVASTGIIDSTNTNREVDLNMFPTELFSRLTVSKSPMADMIEGGAAGVVWLHTPHPFDNPGFHVNYNLQLTDQSTTNFAIGKRGAAEVSDTIGPWGLLAAVAGVQSNMFVQGFEDGNASWYGPNIPPGTCTAPGTGNTCSQFGSSAWTIPTDIQSGVFVPVPAGYTLDPGWSAQVNNGTAYLPSGYPVSQRLLYALNPALAGPNCSKTNPTPACLNQMSTALSNALLPRLGRPMYEKGSRDRYNAVLAFEYRPGEAVHAYLDFVFGKFENHMDRADMGWGVRTGNASSQMVPAGVMLSPLWLASPQTSGLGGAVRQGTFYNPTFGLEGRDYRETGDFINLNPGMTWRPSEAWKIDFQAYYSSSHFFRRNPTVMVSSCTGGPLPVSGIDNCPNGFPATGTVLQFDATGVFPTETLNIDLNDPRNFEWNLGRVNLNGEKRWTTTHGLHLDAAYGGEKIALKAGVAYDVTYRLIRGYDDSTSWLAAICGNNPSFVVYGPNSSMPSCTGQNTTSAPVGWPVSEYPGWGTGYTAGQPPLSFSGSLVPSSQLYRYLKPGPTGFIAVDYDKIFAVSNYWPIMQRAVNALSCVPRCNTKAAVEYPTFLTSAIDERTLGFYTKIFGTVGVVGRDLKYDVGLRWVETRQFILSPTTTNDPRNATLADGGYYPSYQQLSGLTSRYQAFLPSASVAYGIADNVMIRASLSRTMTRANPGDMRGTMDFGDPTVSIATLGNPKLKPFFSDNIDVGAEVYTGGEGYVGLTYFRKAISGFSAQITTQRTFAYLAQYGITYNTLAQTQKNAYALGGPSGQSCNSDATCGDHPVYVNQQVNLPGLEIINGVEFSVVQPLDWVTAPYFGIEGFGVAGNWTMVNQHSTGSVPTYAQGVSPYQYNVTGYYEADGLMLRLAYNWNDASYGSASQSGGTCLPVMPDGTKSAECPGGAYQFNQAYGQADFSSSFRLSQAFGELPTDPQLTFDIQNLFNAKQRSYLMYPDTVHNYYIKGRNYLVGLRGSF